MHPTTGRVILGLSALGYPITEGLVRRWGAPGARVVEAVCLALLVRDGVLIARGTPRVLRPVPASLLWLEAVAAAGAAATTLPRALGAGPSGSGRRSAPGRDSARQAAVATLFVLHTIRFRIYLRPGQGRRAAVRDAASAMR